MSHAWMPGAIRMPAEADGGPMQGGAPRVVWQSLGSDPRLVSARSAGQRVSQLGRASHLVWNPVTGETVQLIPIVRAACSLGCPESLAHAGPPGPAEAGTVAGPVQRAAASLAADGRAAANAEGRLCVQIWVVAFAWEPFTSGPLTGVHAIMRWLDSWAVPRQWPAGRPAPFPHGHAVSGSRRLWSRGGHFGASQVPGLTAAGPGAIDVELITGRTVAPAAALPAGAEVTGQENTRPARPAVALPELAGIFEASVPSAPLTRVS